MENFHKYKCPKCGCSNYKNMACEECGYNNLLEQDIDFNIESNPVSNSLIEYFWKKFNEASRIPVSMFGETQKATENKRFDNINSNDHE